MFPSTSHLPIIDGSEFDTFDQIPAGLREALASELGAHGVATLQLRPGDRQIARQNLMNLPKWFGKLIAHSPLDPLTDITALPTFNDRSIVRPQSDTGTQEPHVDGVLLDETPAIIAMYCIRPAALGGETVLVDARELLRHLFETAPSFISTLFEPDAVTISRHHQKRVVPVFRESNGIIMSMFSSHEYNEARPRPEVVEAFNAVATYVSNPENQILFTPTSGSLTFYVNQRMLHGRRAFLDKVGSERHYVRAWYDGTGVLTSRKTRGVLVSELSDISLPRRPWSISNSGLL